MTRLFTLLIVALLGFPTLASADPAPSREDREVIEKKIETMRVYALTDALDLDEETAIRLFPSLKETDGPIRELHRTQKQNRRELKEAVQGGALDDDVVDALLEAISDTEIALIRAKAEQLAGLKDILSPDQRAKFFVSQEKFDREMRRKLREIRRERRMDRRCGGRE